MEDKIVEFLRNQTQENREIIDEISGMIFQRFPNIKERLINEKLKYIHVSKGVICKIFIKFQLVILEFPNLKETIKFEQINSINRREIINILKNI